MLRAYPFIAAFAALTLLAGCAESSAIGVIGGADNRPTASASQAAAAQEQDQDDPVAGESGGSVSQSSGALLPPKKSASAEKQQKMTVSFSSDSVPVGELVMITVEGVQGMVTATTELSVAPVFFRQEEKQVAMLPVSYKTEPGSYELVLMADGQTNKYAVEVADRKFDVQHLTVDPSTTKETVGSQKANQEWNEKIEPLKLTSDPEKYWSGAFFQPVQGRITTEYGSQRYTNGGSVPSRHGGIDIAAPTGTPVAATGEGRVLFADFIALTGNTVLIEHGYGLKSFYYHMDSLHVKAGDIVERGQQIGAVGSTGFSTGPHLHFAMAVNTVYTNPWALFEKEVG